MSRLSLAGAAAFVAGPVLGIAGVLAAATMSDDAATQVAAYADHHGSMIASAVLQMIGILGFVGGIVWLATAVSARGRGLAAAGGIAGVAGSLIILFEDGLGAAVPSVVSALGPAQATSVVDRIHSSTAGSLEPISLLQAIGCLILAVCAVRMGVPRWAAALFAIGGFVDTIGFATASKPVVVVGFLVLLAGLLPLIRSFAGREPAPVAAAQTA